MFDILIAALFFPLGVPAFALLAFSVAALWPRKVEKVGAALDHVRPRIVVLIPAHNESAHVIPTIQSVKRQLKNGDRILVVADNCADDTAACAISAGADVVERHSESKKGKGYALSYGIEHLRGDPPDVVVIIDADCVLSEDALQEFGGLCARSQRPVQILNLMKADPGAGVGARILEFAMRMKNWVRPLGTARLGGVCHLMGTGMAFPWSLIVHANLATGHVAEDMLLGIDLTLSGNPVHFFDGARVDSRFPVERSAAKIQKTRWVHGHLSLMADALPKLLAVACRKRSLALAVLALDLSIPPIALYTLTLGLATSLLVVFATFWDAWFYAACIMLLALSSLVLALMIGWWKWGRDLLAFCDLLAIPGYFLWKLPVYFGYFLGRRSSWVRTSRNK